MDNNSLPRTTIVGRVANRPRIVTSKRGNHYALLLMYIQDSHSARLIPVISFGKNAENLVPSVEQGNRIALHARLDAISRGRFLNPSLIALSCSVLDTENEQKAEKTDLSKFFPFVPDNLPDKVKIAGTGQKRTDKPAAEKTRPVEHIQPEERPSYEQGWLSNVEDMSDFSFPSLK